MFRSRMSIFGLILTGLGAIATYDAFCARPDRILPRELETLIFFGPILLAVGCVILLRGRSWGSSVAFRRGVLWLGLLMLLIGGYPWAYTSLLIGGRPGNEGAGMLGTILFTLVGLPGLALTLIGLAINSKNEK